METWAGQSFLLLFFFSLSDGVADPCQVSSSYISEDRSVIDWPVRLFNKTAGDALHPMTSSSKDNSHTLECAL